jgi:ADP-ribose pyrophosphatase YjhB (NUDIX family)
LTSYSPHRSPVGSISRGERTVEIATTPTKASCGSREDRSGLRLRPGKVRWLPWPNRGAEGDSRAAGGRAILIDDDCRLVLIRRTKPGQAPYWTAPGGGVDASDASVEAALHCELAEELGAEASGATQVFLFSSPSEAGVAVQHFFVARLRKLDESARSGPEFQDASRGRYDLDRIALLGDDLASVDLKPDALKEFILANREALLAEAAAS